MFRHALGARRVARLVLSGSLLAAAAVPLAPPAAAQVPPAAPSLMPFTADAYPRATTPTLLPGGARAYPLKTTVLANGQAVVADRLLVRFAPTTNTSDRDAVNASAARSGHLAGRFVGQLSPTDYLVDVSGATSLEDAAAFYRADRRVTNVGADLLTKADFTPNDPLLGSQWGMARIQAPAAWNRSHGGSAAGMIAILDSGIDESHPDLARRVATGHDFTGSGSGTQDLVGHGTHVAGIASAITNNGLGVAGVGYDTTLLNGKVLDDTGGGSLSQLVDGINWAASNGATVINMSLGASTEHFWDDCEPTLPEELGGFGRAALRDAIDAAWNQGITLVAAAGNNGDSFQQWPASCAHVLSVANTRSDDSLAPDSTRGAWVDVAAPGSGILSTFKGGGFATLSGTSMASPHVAGLAALVRASCGLYGPSAAPGVWDRITNNTDQIAGTGSLFAFGRVNAFRAVCFPAPQNLRAGVIGTTSIQILWTGMAPGEKRFEIAIQPPNSDPNTRQADRTVPADQLAYTDTVPAGATFDYSVRACDEFGCSAWTGPLELQSNVKVLSVSRAATSPTEGVPRGGVRSDTPGGINCGNGGGVCSKSYSNGSVVTLTASGYANQKLNIFWAFDHWEGDCTGTARTCTLQMTANHKVTAVFTNLSD